MTLTGKTLVAAVVGLGMLATGLNVAEAGRKGGGHHRFGLRIGGFGIGHHGNHHKGNHHGNHQSHHHHHGHHHHWHRGFGLYIGVPYRPPVTGYTNPYACGPSDFGGAPGINTTVPIDARQNGNGMSQQVMQQLDAARRAFMAGNYDAAMQSVNNALNSDPQEPNALQFQSLILFAKGMYRESAGVAHVALTSGRGWNWETLRGLYRSIDAYTAQLRALERAVDKSPKDAAPRFLLAYHYLMMGHVPQAARQLQQVVALQPTDELSKQLLEQIADKAGLPPADDDSTIPGPPTEDASVDPADTDNAYGDDEGQIAENGLDALGFGPSQVSVKPTTPVSNTTVKRVGTFVARPADGVEIRLVLKADGSFVWSVTANGQKDEFAGTFKIENGELTLIRKADGKKLVGTITESNDGSFTFKLKGGDAADPGLKFSRSA